MGIIKDDTKLLSLSIWENRDANNTKEHGGKFQEEVEFGLRSLLVTFMQSWSSGWPCGTEICLGGRLEKQSQNLQEAVKLQGVKSVRTRGPRQVPRENQLAHSGGDERAMEDGTEKKKEQGASV